MRFPDFFILGGPKCGTTSVFEWLRSHPDTWLPTKEPNYLSPDVYDVPPIKGGYASFEKYLDDICPVETSGRLTGDATPRSLYSDDALAAIACHGSRARLLVLLRNPVDLVFSLHGQMVKEGVEHELRFEDAWRRSLGDHARESWIVEGRVDRRLDYPLFGAVGSRIQKVCELFEPTQVKTLILEEQLSKDPPAAFREITDFLGLSPFTPPSLNVANSRQNVRSVRLQFQVARAREVYLRALRRLGINLPRGTHLLRLVQYLNRGPRDRRSTQIPAGLRAEIAEYFAQEVATVRAVLGRHDLPWTDFN